MEPFPYCFEAADIAALRPLVEAHSASLAAPWDSFMEEHLSQDAAIAILHGGTPVGYATVGGELLCTFYVAPPHYRHAPAILEAFVQRFGIRTAQLLTHDPLLAALLMEWDSAREDWGGCFFTDGGRLEKPAVEVAAARFREAVAADIPRILNETGDFFDKLTQRVAARTIFLLEDGEVLLGCGIVEQSTIQPVYVSIGMITCRNHRRKGVAQTVLWHLKEWAYTYNLRPIAGCWYCNILSRRSLEAAGMLPVGKSLILALHGKPVLPLRTGNPPGELVESSHGGASC